MAIRRNLVQSLLNLPRISGRVFPPCTSAKAASPDPGDDGLSRPHIRQLWAAAAPEQQLHPHGKKVLLEKIRETDIARKRVGWRQPPAQYSPEGRLKAADVRKIVWIWQLEKVRSKLREIEEGRVSYGEFLQICVKECRLNVDQGLEFAKKLDESGSVIIIGDTVFLRPEQFVKAIQDLALHSPSADKNSCADSRTKELQEMEKRKVAIDKNAESQVRNELWCGLGYLIIQTAVFMRLTFWDLTWDVMEPICFYVTSFYVVGGYTFFLKTSKEPSFEGFFQSRFRTKQSRLMQLRNFDVERYNELKKGSHLLN